MSYKAVEKKIKKEVVQYAQYVVQVADLITPETKKDLVQSIQKESQILYRNIMKIQKLPSY